MGRTDIGLVSYGDFPMAQALVPAVTVVDQNPAGLGRFAVERLYRRIDTPGLRLRRRTVLPVELLVRESCGTASPIPAAGHPGTSHDALLSSACAGRDRSTLDPPESLRLHHPMPTSKSLSPKGSTMSPASIIGARPLTPRTCGASPVHRVAASQPSVARSPPGWVRACWTWIPQPIR